MAIALAEHQSYSGSGLSPSPFNVSLEFFSGPLDLLLHLVHRQEVSVKNVEMARVCEQYVDIVTRSALFDLNLASEYLVIAATLVALKSESLLPKQSLFGEGLEYEEGSSFYEELRERLKRYEEVKRQAQELSLLPHLGFDTFVRKDKSLQAPVEGELEVNEDAHALGVAFSRMLKRIGATVRGMRIRLEPISVVNYMMRILGVLQVELPEKDHSQQTQLPAQLPGQRPVSFFNLLRLLRGQERQKTPSAEGRQDSLNDRSVIIGGFIALLELVRRGLVKVSQQSDTSDMTLHLQMLSPDGAILDSEFDQPAASATEDASENKVVHLGAYLGHSETRSGKQLDGEDSSQHDENDPMLQEVNR